MGDDALVELSPEARIRDRVAARERTLEQRDPARCGIGQLRERQSEGIARLELGRIAAVLAPARHRGLERGEPAERRERGDALLEPRRPQRIGRGNGVTERPEGALPLGPLHVATGQCEPEREAWAVGSREPVLEGLQDEILVLERGMSGQLEPDDQGIVRVGRRRLARQREGLLQMPRPLSLGHREPQQHRLRQVAGLAGQDGVEHLAAAIPLPRRQQRIAMQLRGPPTRIVREQHRLGQRANAGPVGGLDRLPCLAQHELAAHAPHGADGQDTQHCGHGGGQGSDPDATDATGPTRGAHGWDSARSATTTSSPRPRATSSTRSQG